MLVAYAKPSSSFTSNVSETVLSNSLQNAPLGSKVNIIIETKTSDYSNMINYINSIGGEVHYTYKYVNAISASIPANSLPNLQTSPDVTFIYKDTIVGLAAQPTVDPEGIDTLISQPTKIERDIQGIPIDPDQLSRAELNTYWNPTVSNATPLWDAEYRGKNTTVAIIDTGIWTGHFMFRRTSIIGGADLSFDNYTIYQQYADIIPWPYNETYEGWDNPYNHWHGSHVAGIIAGRGAILLPENHTLTQAVERYTGTPLPSAEPYGYPGYKILYLFGIAPYANLYIVKVFDHTGSGIPESLVLNAIEHVIDLKLQEVDMDVISMSLGGPTLYDGRDLEDKLVDYATSVGITVVAAAGNDGPARMTVSSPGSANTAITVAAAADPVHTRVFWDYYYDTPGLGYYLYKTDENQIIYFSSKGPTSDGRQKPTIAATGVFVLSAYRQAASKA
jgi:subtilisin family serine protease